MADRPVRKRQPVRKDYLDIVRTRSQPAQHTPSLPPRIRASSQTAEGQVNPFLSPGWDGRRWLQEEEEASVLELSPGSGADSPSRVPTTPLALWRPAGGSEPPAAVAPRDGGQEQVHTYNSGAEGGFE